MRGKGESDTFLIGRLTIAVLLRFFADKLVTKTSTGAVIGASGGDSVAACENTAAATTAGLSAGMNAVELDISVSRDQGRYIIYCLMGNIIDFNFPH